MAFTKKQREKVFDRDGGLCIVRGPSCFGHGQVLHHRANRGMGGAGKTLDRLSNALLSCSPCNGWIEDSTDELREILIVRGVRVIPASTHAATAARARETSVVYPDGRVFMLLDDGTREEVDVG